MKKHKRAIEKGKFSKEKTMRRRAIRHKKVKKNTVRSPHLAFDLDFKKVYKFFVKEDVAEEKHVTFSSTGKIS